MGSKTKRITAASCEQVWIQVGILAWSRLPQNIKHDLLRGIERIARLRQSIAESAKVITMPPVEVVCEVWRLPHATIDGRVMPLRTDAGMQYGVQIPALTAVCEDEPVVRAVLVHEYCHCFYYVKKIFLAASEK